MGTDESRRDRQSTDSESARSASTTSESGLTLTNSADRRRSAIRDKTATDVFRSLSSDGPAIDTDAVLDGTTPAELIDRATDPPRAQSTDSTLFDADEFEQLLLPDRRSDGSFLWIEPAADDSPATPSGTETGPADGERERSTERDDETESTMHSTPTTDDGGRTNVTDDDTETVRDGSAAQVDDQGPTPDESIAWEASAESTTDETDWSATVREKAAGSGKVPPRAATDTAESTAGERGSERRGASAEHATDRTAASTEPETEPTGPDDSQRSVRVEDDPTAPDSNQSKSEIRTTIEYYDHRKPAQSSRVDVVKRLLSRVPGLGGRS
ncbi:hypothetical protein [Halovivax cerinus]|uniref:Uncharacterized protein n=1 Tax=Halovivax cerinus TaxID=1487865 RepID=A0ABD5NSH7_9EURY|nr:hypothetical protein [Halovivax cerinus]